MLFFVLVEICSAYGITLVDFEANNVTNNLMWYKSEAVNFKLWLYISSGMILPNLIENYECLCYC